jgi:hypothetical protein
MKSGIRATRSFVKKCPIFQKIAKKVSEPKKCQNSFNKAQIQSTKYLDQITFETLKYLRNKPSFEHVYLGENVIELL